MSSNGLRFPQKVTSSASKSGQQAQQQTPTKRVAQPTNSLSEGSDTDDVSMSNENLSHEAIWRHTSRVEPQGQENHSSGNLTPVNDAHPTLPSRFSSNTSTDSNSNNNRYTPASNRSISECRTPVYSNPTATDSNRSSVVVQTNNNSNRNSLKETNSNRSSMDTSSYNTLIIHADENIYALNRDYSSPPPYLKKDRPRSYGEQHQQQIGMQEITEIPEEYLNTQVLKHLAKEVKIPTRQPIRSASTRDSGLSDNASITRDHPPKYNWIIEGQNTKIKSKSQPDLTRLIVGEVDIDIEALIKENSELRQQLQNCYSRVAKSQKLEHEVSKIYRDHEDLVNSSERRERLERAARNRLQSDCRRLMELNRALRDQVEVLQQQLVTQPSDQLGRSTQHDALITQLVTQNKDLVDANKRQYVEIQAQSATLEEQRIHINVLDTALKRLEEECRQKQLYVAQLQHAFQSERRELADRKLRYDYDSEMSKDSNRSGSSISETNNLKWQLREKDSQIIRLENECATLQQRNVAKLTIEKNAQDTERAMTEAKQEKLRYLDETHSANRKVTELQTRLKVVENRLNEKEAMIRALQVYGSSNSYSGGSYNLSTDSFALGYTPSTGGGQASFDVSSTSYENSPTQYGGVQTTSGFSPSSSIATAYATSIYGQTNPTFNQSAINLHNHVNYSPNSSSNFSSNYGGPNTSYAQAGNLVDDPIFDAQRKSIGDQLKQLDEQLLNKVSELHMVKQQINRTTSTLQNGYAMNKGQSTIEIDKKQHGKSHKLTNSCKDMTTTDKEVFY